MKKKILITLLVLIISAAALLAYYVPEESGYHEDGSHYVSFIFNSTITPFHFTDLLHTWWYFEARRPFILGATIFLWIGLLVFWIFKYNNLLMAIAYIMILDNIVNIFYDLFMYQMYLPPLADLGWALVGILMAHLLKPDISSFGAKKVVEVHYRILHFFIDTALIIIIFVKLFSLFQLPNFQKIFIVIKSHQLAGLIQLAGFMSYYCFFEIVFGTTPGKIIFGHYVANKDGSKPSKSTIALRSACRLIPFDFMSFVFTYDWHDKISKTLIVKPMKKNL